LQLPITGHPLHTRTLSIIFLGRDDGCWRLRGDVIDLRKCGFVPMPQDLQPAGIIHQMVLEATVDPRDGRLLALATEQPHVAIEASEWSRGECCRDPAPLLQALVGEPFDADFARKLSEVFGGPRGCSHLLTLFQLASSAVIRAVAIERESQTTTARGPSERFFRRTAYVDGFATAGGDIELGLQLHDFHTRSGTRFASPLDRLERHDEVRAFARVAMPSMKIEAMHAAERHRHPQNVAEAPWRSRDQDVAALVGPVILPGMAGRLFARFGGSEDSRLLLDGLLQLAPTHIQVLAALADRWVAQRAEGGEREASADGGGLAVASLGGFPDSCYMWRSDGPLNRMRQNGPRET